MNLLIVDDEYLVVEEVVTVTDWELLGITEIYSATNALNAVRILNEKKIDIMICDIEMPKENGLSLIQWIQDMYPEIINIILTGYPDFNYARSAISLGVYRYLLKPIAFD